MVIENIEKTKLWNFELGPIDGIQSDVLPDARFAGKFNPVSFHLGKQKVLRQIEQTPQGSAGSVQADIEYLEKDSADAQRLLNTLRYELAGKEQVMPGVGCYDPDGIAGLKRDIALIEARIQTNSAGIERRKLNQSEIIHTIRE
jgi:hypothetical protein